MIQFLLSILLILSPPTDFYWYPATLEGCYDGDTCTLTDMDLGLKFHHHDVILRLYGINTPELRGAEREAGLRSRDYLLSLIHPGDRILIHTHRDESGKYGRLLATIFYACDTGWCNANQELLDRGLAIPYGS